MGFKPWPGRAAADPVVWLERDEVVFPGVNNQNRALLGGITTSHNSSTWWECLPTEKGVVLSWTIITDLQMLHQKLSVTLLFWSCFPEFRKWKGGLHRRKGGPCQEGSICEITGWIGSRHPDISFQQDTMYRSDGVHLSEWGIWCSVCTTSIRLCCVGHRLRNFGGSRFQYWLHSLAVWAFGSDSFMGWRLHLHASLCYSGACLRCGWVWSCSDACPGRDTSWLTISGDKRAQLVSILCPISWFLLGVFK